MTQIELNESESKFLAAYTRYGADTFGNAYKSLVETRHWNGTKESAYSYASQIKNSPRVKQALKRRIKEMGLSHFEVDTKLLELIKQDKDLRVKLQAIMEYNRLMGRGKAESNRLEVRIQKFS